MPELDDAGIRRYLLGLLPAAEAEALEQAYLAQPEVLERVRGVEDDLLDDYAAGRLDPSEKEPFESRYLSAPPLRERVVAARALHLAGAGVARLSPARGVPAGWQRWRAPVGLAAGLFLAVAGAWLLRARSPVVSVVPASPTSVASSKPSTRASPVPAASPSLPTLGTTRAVFALSPVLLRGQGGSAELSIPPGTGTVVLELQGDAALVPPGARRLRVVIRTVEGEDVWSGPARGVAPSGLSLPASVVVPAEELGPGDYLAALTADGPAGGTLYRYFFRVSKQS